MWQHQDSEQAKGLHAAPMFRASALTLLSFIALAAMNLPASLHAQDVVGVTRAGNKEYHQVDKGDTLYDLSDRYLGDSYEWPRLWSFNPHITNPHWIYPGDIVYLRPKTEISNTPAGPRRLVTRNERQNEVHVALGGFIEDKELKYVGRIVASPKQASMLGEYDKVWLGFGDKSYSDKEKEEIDEEDRIKFQSTENKVKVGDVFAIVRPAGTIKDSSDDEKVLGHKYKVLGSLRVTETSDKFYQSAEILQSWQEIQRGDLLIPYERQLKFAQPVQADKNMVAKIVDLIEPRSSLGEFHYVFVNKGAKQGVRVGNRFFVYQRQEGLTFHDNAEAKEPDAKVPWSRIGQIILIDVRENYSTGIITDSAREIFVGDRLEMYEGY